MRIGCNADEQATFVCRLERLVDAPRAAPRRHWRRRFAARGLTGHVLGDEKGGRLEQAADDLAAFAVLLALTQGSEDGDGAHDTTHDVND